MANLERIYTIPLKDAYEHPRNKRGKRAIRLIQDFALRHMKAEDVRVSEGVNSNILRDGIEKPPRRIKVRMVKGEDALVRVWLIGEEEKIKAAADKKKKESEDKKTAVLPSKTAPIRAGGANRETEEAAKKAEAAKKEAAKPASTAAAVGAQSPKATQAAPAAAAKPK